MPSPVVLLKVDPDTGVSLRNKNGFCVKADVNEPGEIVGEIRQNVPYQHYDGYQDELATKKVLCNIFKSDDMYTLCSGDVLHTDERYLISVTTKRIHFTGTGRTSPPWRWRQPLWDFVMRWSMVWRSQGQRTGLGWQEMGRP